MCGGDGVDGLGITISLLPGCSDCKLQLQVTSSGYLVQKKFIFV